MTRALALFILGIHPTLDVVVCLADILGDCIVRLGYLVVAVERAYVEATHTFVVLGH